MAPPSLRSDQKEFARPIDSRIAAIDLKFAINVSQVGLNRVLGDVKGLSNGAYWLGCGEVFDDLKLTARQVFLEGTRGLMLCFDSLSDQARELF